MNDQVATGIGGNFLGEPLFRMASLLLEGGEGDHPGFWRELGAAALSPSLGFNRLVYGKRFDPVFRSFSPAVFTRVVYPTRRAPSALQRNYHYGIAPESIVALRLTFADRAALDTSARGYYISRLAASESTGSETIDRFNVALTVRVFDLHGLTLSYSQSTRDGRYVGLPDSHQSVRTISIGYTLLGHTRLGAVEWRNDSRQSEQ